MDLLNPFTVWNPDDFGIPEIPLTNKDPTGSVTDGFPVPSWEFEAAWKAVCNFHPWKILSILTSYLPYQQVCVDE
jgi:hypothetical protein